MDARLQGYFEGEADAQVPLPVTRVRQRKSLKLMELETQSLVAAALHAADQASLPGELGPRWGICVAAPKPTFPEPTPPSVYFDAPTAQTVLREWPPLWLLCCLPNMAASHLAIQFQATGPAHTLGTTDWKSLIDLATSWIGEQRVDGVIVAGRSSDGKMRAAILASKASPP